jgi:primosomal protein N' (replication factor Y)
MPTLLQAQVALKRPIKGNPDATLSYAIPIHLRDQVQLGQLVWVPLQNQFVQGVILSLAHSPSPNTDYRLRDIADIADPEAIIPPIGLELARAVADHIFVSLYDVLTLMLPPGTAQTAAWTWRVTPAGLDADLASLPEQERGILYYLRKQGETTEQELQRVLHGSKQKLRATWEHLLERGFIAQGIQRSKPKVKPRMQRTARLLTTPEETPAILDKITRSTKQQTVVDWMAAQPTGELATPPAIPVGEIYKATGGNLSVLRSLETKQILELETREVWRSPLVNEYVPPDSPPPLTTGQRQVWEQVAQALDTLFPSPAPPAPVPIQSKGEPQHLHHPVVKEGQGRIFLLHGVTGSGKTEIYMRAVARVLRRGLQALILVPEIALTAQLVRRFAARFPEHLAVLHSQLSAGERYDEWRRVRQGKAQVVIGSRSAIFAPLARPGVIIVDEEHEPSYKQDDHPRYHARDVALMLGALAKGVVILGSATPSVESYYAANQGYYTLLSMPERVGTIDRGDGLIRSQPLPLPHVALIDMRRELEQDNRSIFSRPLQTALAEVLEQGEQAMLFLNRRGAAAFVMCRDCGYVATCPSCGTSLVLHYADHYESPNTTSTLACHACSHREIVPSFCPQCLSPNIKSFGVGTQRVEQEVVRLFPHARPLRWDRDTATGKGAHSRLLDQFLRHEADVLVGTQMIARGLDLPRVSLVGVVAADTALFLPDFRSGERTFQLLTQVAGRAGRRSSGAKVIIQTYTPEHYALQAAREHDYRHFYQQEIGFRRQAQYPPYGRLVRFLTMHKSQATAAHAAETLAGTLHAAIKRNHLAGWRVIGPAPATIQQIRGRWRWHLLLRIPSDIPDTTTTLATLLDEFSPMSGWTIDVDPVHVL